MLSVLVGLIINQARRRPFRVLMTVAGITLGVAAAVAVGVVRESLNGAFVALVDDLAGNATLQIGGDGVAVPIDMLEQARAVKGVSRATASMTMMGRLVDYPDAGILLAGVDVLDPDTAKEFQVSYNGQVSENGQDFADIDPVLFLNAKNSLLVSAKFAKRHHLLNNQELKVLTPGGVVSLRVRGFLADKGPAKIFDGNYGLMYLDAAQALFNRGDTVDRIDIETAATADVGAVMNQLKKELGDKAAVERPERRGARMDQFLSTLNLGILLLSAMALFVGMFLVYNTVATSVAERRREIGILRALGMGRTAIVTWFASEAGLYGALGSVLGIPTGIGLGRLALYALSAQVQLVLPLSLDQLVLPRPLLIGAFAAGVIASILAALPPAFSAAKVAPREAAEQGRHAVLTGSRIYLLSSIGVGLSIFSLLSFRATVRDNELWVYGGQVATLLASVAFVPLLSAILGKALAWLLQAVFGITGRLAADHLQRARAMTTVTVSALSVGVCLAVTAASVTASFKQSAVLLLDQNLPADLFIHSGSRYIGNTNTLMPDTLAPDIAQLADVSATSAVRLIPFYLYGDQPVALMALSAHEHLRRMKPHLEEGTFDQVMTDMDGGKAVLVSSNFALHYNRHRGSQLTLATPTGPLTLLVAGTYTDYLSPNGTVVLDQATYARAFKDHLIDSVDVFLDDKSKLNAVRDDIAQRFGQKYGFLLLKNEEIRADLMHLIDQTFVLVYAEQVVAMLVAVLGILNALLVAVMERTRELGVLRAEGLERRQVVQLILIEAGVIGFLGSVIGTLFGWAMAYQNVTTVVPHQTGWMLQFNPAVGAAATILALSVLAAIAAGFYPARRAARMTVSQALSYE